MPQKTKDGKRATGIQSKHGFLYILKNERSIVDGRIHIGKKWISTNLRDSPENVAKAMQMRELYIEHDGRRKIIEKSILVSDYIDVYLNRAKRNIADTTLYNYTNRMNVIRDFFHNVRMIDIRIEDVNQFLDYLLGEKKLQKRSVKDIKAAFRLLFEEAKKDCLVVMNPVEFSVINKRLGNENSKTQKDDTFFSYEEALRFLEYTKEHELYFLFYLTLFFGLRREEVLGLKWSAIDLINKRMKINHTVTKGTKINRLNTTKTESSNRTYVLSDEQVELFRQKKKEEDKYRVLCGNSYYESDYVFRHADGTLYHPDYPSKAFSKIIARHPDLPPNITFHGLRSSCVSILIHNGMDVKSVQHWVGHADIETTLKIYARVKEKEVKESVARKMNEMIRLETKEKQ